jgi:hypothetical protein
MESISRRKTTALQPGTFKTQRMTKQKRKLQTALIETGKEVEGMKQIPSLAEMEDRFERFKIAIQNDDMKKMRLFGRQLSSMVTKFMIEKL